MSSANVGSSGLKDGTWRLLDHVTTAALAVAAGVFVIAWGLDSYSLSANEFQGLRSQGTIPAKHAPALLDALAPLVGTSHRTVFSFVDAVQMSIADANEALPNDTKIWEYDRGVYTLELVRCAATGPVSAHTTLFFLLTIGLAAIAGIAKFGARIWREHAGVRNDRATTSSLQARGAVGIAVAVALVGFYVLLYFFPHYIVSWISIVDPLSEILRGTPADRWFFYGALYTVAVIVMGLRMAVHYRHNAYHLVRTGSIVFFQLGTAFLLPAIMGRLQMPAVDIKSAWPLNYSFFYDYNLNALIDGGAVGIGLLAWGIALSFVVVPLLAALVGKRWYCSWVCGCGGLAETLGDPFRHLSDKRLNAWRVERWLIHAVLVAAVAMTGIVLGHYFSGGSLFSDVAWRVREWYGFLIGSIFAGVVGTGFYPLMGNRVWCRFGCPLAAWLGIVQRFTSRFRVTVNGGQCISCGNCSVFCEMGIDVRWYAQRGQNVVRASCVGCGVCATVCPRGVLRLENGPTTGRINHENLLQNSP